VTVRVSPQPAYIAADECGQSLSVDLLIENPSAEPLDPDEVKISVFDRGGKAMLREFIDGNGTRPSIRTADAADVPADRTTMVFNPFHDFASDVDLHAVRRYRSRSRLVLPLKERMIVYDSFAPWPTARSSRSSTASRMTASSILRRFRRAGR
jgi:hypothetical protein